MALHKEGEMGLANVKLFASCLPSQEILWGEEAVALTEDEAQAVARHAALGSVLVLQSPRSAAGSSPHPAVPARPALTALWLSLVLHCAQHPAAVTWAPGDGMGQQEVQWGWGVRWDRSVPTLPAALQSLSSSSFYGFCGVLHSVSPPLAQHGPSRRALTGLSLPIA